MTKIDPRYYDFVYVDRPDDPWEGLAVRDLNNGKWRVLESVRFMHITLEAGFETDFYSIPWYARMIIPKVQRRGNIASAFHDFIITELADFYPRSHADKVFMQAMKKSGVRKLRRFLIHGGVSGYTKYLPWKFQLLDKLKGWIA